jgi:hypothetical protein
MKGLYQENHEDPGLEGRIFSGLDSNRIQVHRYSNFNVPSAVNTRRLI